MQSDKFTVNFSGKEGLGKNTRTVKVAILAPEWVIMTQILFPIRGYMYRFVRQRYLIRDLVRYLARASFVSHVRKERDGVGVCESMGAANFYSGNKSA